MRLALVLALLGLVAGCASGPGGASSTPVATQGAQEVGRDQGTGQATETVSSTNNITPTTYTFFGIRRAVLTQSPDGSSNLEVVGEAANAEDRYHFDHAVFGTSIGERSANPHASAGGSAAGGAGESERSGTATTTTGTGN